MKRKWFALAVCCILLLSCVGGIPVTAEEYMLGDLDGDEFISPTDARLLCQYIIKKIDSLPLGDPTLADIDINGDGKVTMADARILLQHYAQDIDDFSDVTESDGGTLPEDFFSFSEPKFDTYSNTITVTVKYNYEKPLLDGVFYVSYPSDKVELVVAEKTGPVDPVNRLSSMANAQVNPTWDEGVIAVGFLAVRNNQIDGSRALELTFRPKTAEGLTFSIAAWADQISALGNTFRQSIRLTGSRETAVTADLTIPATSITPPTQTLYAVGDSLNLEGSYVTYTYPDGTTETEELRSNMFSGFDSSKPGIQTVTITCGNVSTTFEVEVVEPVLVYIGDVDLDGAITSTDARIVLQYYVGKFTAADIATLYVGVEGGEEVFRILADADEDGQITSTDARLILQYYAGKI